MIYKKPTDLSLTTHTDYLCKRILFLERELSRVSRLITIDPLTGLLNKNVFNEFLDREIKRSCETGVTFSVIFFHVNDLKYIEEKFGSQGVDDILIKLTDILMKASMPASILCRVNNDEFASLIPNSTFSDAANFIKHARVGIDKTGLTFFSGISVYPIDGDNKQSLLMSSGQFSSSFRDILEKEKVGV